MKDTYNIYEKKLKFNKIPYISTFFVMGCGIKRAADLDLRG